MRVGSLTDVGKVRSSNEDAYGVDVQRGVFIVADGMGGHQAGEVASQQAVDSLLESLVNRDAAEAPAEAPADAPADAMRRAVDEANKQIAAAAQKDRNLKGMGTTVVAAIVDGDRFTIAHVGDSRAYLVRDGAIKQLTEDHSMVAELVKAGVITPEAAETHPYRSAISRSLGQFKEVETDTAEYDFEPGDIVLLCTDGLTRFAKPEEILERILAHDDPQDAAQALIDLANEHGGRDNITVILIANS